MRGRVLSQPTRRDGYKVVNLSRENNCKTWLVHQLICFVFHGERPEWAEHVRHLDGDKSNNHADNIVYGTAAENSLDVIVHGRNHQRRKTHCPKGHEYTRDNTSIRQRGTGVGRGCKTCSSESSRIGYAKLKTWREGNDPGYKAGLRVTHCPQGHEYSVENTMVKDGARNCRACARSRHKRWRQSRRSERK